MIMEDPRFHEYTSNDFSLDDENNNMLLPSIFDQFPSYIATGGGYRFRDEPLDLSFLDAAPSPPPVANHGCHHPVTPPPTTTMLNSPPGMAGAAQIEDSEYDQDSVFKFLNQILVEENMEAGNNYKQSSHHLFNDDPFALQATEDSFYEALGISSNNNNNRPPPLILIPNDQTPEEIVCGMSSSEYSTCGSSDNNSAGPRWVRSDSFDTNSSVTTTQAHSLDHQGPTTPFRSATDANDTMDSINTHIMLQNMFTDSESILQFKRGMEEASKFLPPSRPLLIDLDKYNLPSGNSVKVERVEQTDNNPSKGSRRKHFPLEDDDVYYEEDDQRISKQAASAVNGDEEEEAELCKMFDQILLCTNAKGEPVPGFGDLHPGHNNVKHVYNGWNAPWTGNPSENVDIRTLLIKCAQSIADDDHKIASEQLRQIRKHTSPSGNASERLGHIFALGLEARLAAAGSPVYESSQKATKTPATDKLKPFQVYLSACPFVKNEVYYANKMILEAAWTSSTLHIVDFGIAYGFQWPILIKHLADRPGGPPKLRITGIEFPQPGFRPAEMVEETGRRLAIYCERFKVPFEYNALATQNWEMIKVEDLKLHRNEFLVVNSQARFENLLDEVNVTDSPRDGVLKLIRDMKPDIFVHSVVNGSYSSPFFVTRFKEALFHYSSLFDMLDTILDRKNEHRQNFEMEFYGRKVMNVIACEGPQRVERPETYKQWQVRTTRAGFKPRRVNREIVSQLKCKVKVGYHRDFVLDEDGKWMLQGWKGRILYAVSCWVPA